MYVNYDWLIQAISRLKASQWYQINVSTSSDSSLEDHHLLCQWRRLSYSYFFNDTFVVHHILYTTRQRKSLCCQWSELVFTTIATTTIRWIYHEQQQHLLCCKVILLLIMCIKKLCLFNDPLHQHAKTKSKMIIKKTQIYSMREYR